MLERLSPISLKCFDAAKKQARRLRSVDLAPRHLLLGLIECQSSWLSGLLEPYEVGPVELAAALEQSLGVGPAPAPERLVVSAELKAVLKTGIKMSGGVPVTPVDLLVASLQIDRASRSVLERLGIDVSRLLDQLGDQADHVATRTVVGVASPEQIAEHDQSEEGGSAEVTAISVTHRETPTLDRYSRDLTRLARNGELHHIVGREREMAATIEILCRTIKRNPILVGEPGVGKTALAEGLAQRIIARDVPALLRDRRLVELSVSSLVSGASQMGEFENRLHRLVGEVKAAGDVILFVDEAHALMGAGGTYGLQDAATILKPALARGDIVCIGSTTTHEYRKYIEKDGALARRFQPVRVEEPDRETVLEILTSLKPRFEGHFGVQIPTELTAEAYNLAKNYLKNRYFPDKAIDLLERAASRAMLAGNEQTTLTVDTMLSVLSDMTGIPFEKLDQGEMERYLHMEDLLRKRVIGQDRAVEAVASLIRLTKRRLDLDPKRPDGVFLFVGPAGVGKTELAKALTEFLFGDEDRLIRLDMSEFSSEFTVSRLIGSPPGYVGFNQGGQLTERVQRQPFCVVLLDEIEKAHPAVLNLFLQVFDDGHLTDAQGRTVHFSDATIIMTSNLASELWFRRRMGFGESERQVEVAEEAVSDVLRRKLPSEFLSRIDEVVVFDPLQDSEILQISRQKLDTIVRDRFARQGVRIAFEAGVVAHIASIGYEPRQGCRRLERVIQKELLEPLAEQMYRPEWQGLNAVLVRAQDGRIAFEENGDYRGDAG
jgi:ATP-dependent Clp protease ATP-binding subunit ClpC